jgi:2-methylcitrate dehydratase PrpD
VRGFDAPFEGEAGFYRLFAGGAFDPAALTGALGERFWIDELTFKRWPACRGTHAYIEAVQRLRATHHIDVDAVREIVATGGPVQRMLVEPADRKAAPATAIDAKFSIPYTIAAALIDDEVGLDSFADRALARPAARRIAARVRFEQNPEWGRAHAASGRVTIVLADGSWLAEQVDIAAGHPSRPLGDDSLRAKFLACAGHAAKAGDPTELAEALWSLDRAPDCRHLLRHLCYTS